MKERGSKGAIHTVRSKGKRDTKLIGWAGERVERAHSCMHTHTERHCLYTDSENTKETKGGAEAGEAN